VRFNGNEELVNTLIMNKVAAGDVMEHPDLPGVASAFLYWVLA
jgi:hypothetical protein